MTKKSTLSEFIEKSKQKYGNKFNYSKSVYVTCNTPLILICLIENHGEFSYTPKNHFKKTSNGGCKKCPIIKNYDNGRNNHAKKFIDKSKEKFTSKYNYDNMNYTGMNNTVTLTCIEHNKQFNTTALCHIKSEFGCCPDCRWDNTPRLTNEQYIEECKKTHGDLYDYSKTEYLYSKCEVYVGCKIHGFYLQLADNHMRGAGCFKCAKINSRKTLEEFIEESIKIHGDKYNYSESIYNGSEVKLKIICSIHGIFNQVPHSHLKGYGCPSCQNWKTEFECKVILENVTNYVFEKSNPQFLERLHYDWYNEELKLALEYNGEQHYIYIPFFHRTGIEVLEKQQERDKLKVELSYKYGIYLIVIPYYVKDKESYITLEYDNYLYLKFMNFELD